jgi:hypothetical protein
MVIVTELASSDLNRVERYKIVTDGETIRPVVGERRQTLNEG